MKTVFDQLREELESTDNWLGVYLRQSLTPKQRELAEKLREYLGHCHRDKRKWSSASAAEGAIKKIRRAWMPLYFPKIQKGES